MGWWCSGRDAPLSTDLGADTPRRDGDGQHDEDREMVLKFTADELVADCATGRGVKFDVEQRV